MQRSDQPDSPDATPVPAADHHPRLALRPVALGQSDLLPELRRYLLMRPVMFAAMGVVLLLHWADATAFDITTVVLLAGLYALLLGSGGLDLARLSSSGGQRRRQERLADDALRRAGRLQSHLEPGSATDAVLHRVLSNAPEPRRAVILAGNEVEDALRAVYRHYVEAERLAGTSTGADLPLSFLVQELIWRGLLAPDIYDTAEPVLALREMALEPRAVILPQVASDAARAAQAIVLRVESLGIQIHPRRAPLAWLRSDGEGPSDQSPSPPGVLEMDAEEETTAVEDEDETDMGVEPGAEDRQQALPPEQNGLMSGRTAHTLPPDLRAPMLGDSGPTSRPIA